MPGDCRVEILSAASDFLMDPGSRRPIYNQFMDRRRFIEAAVSSLFMVPPLAFAGVTAPRGGSGAADVLFFDDRFASARLLARQWAEPIRHVPVRSDITPVWNAWLKEACQRSVLTLDGITTESFHFCLEIMTAERTRIESRIARVDRDLFLWRIRCDPHIARSVFA